MKAEERHELKENDLASWLQYGLPMFLKQNGSYILLVLALGFLGYQLYNMYQSKQEQSRIKAWDELRSAGSAENPPAKIQSVIDAYDIKPLQAQGYLELGAYYGRLPLYPGELAKLKVSRSEALDKSLECYQKALQAAGKDPLITGKASLGIAAVDEDRGDWDAARKQYETMADPNGAFKGTPFVDVANVQLKTLDDRKRAPRLIAAMPAPATAPASAPAALPDLDAQLPGMFGPPAPETAPAPK